LKSNLEDGLDLFLTKSKKFDKRKNSLSTNHIIIAVAIAIMKFNTKTCTLIHGSPETMVRPNKYISNNKKDTNNDEPITLRQEEVRERKYLPTIIYTPVLTSKRIAHHRRLLSYDDVEELNHKLADIFLEDTNTTAAAAAATSSITEEFSSLSSSSSSSGDEEEEPKQDSEIETNAESSSDQDATNKEENKQEKEEKASLLGRLYKTMFSYKTCKTSKVLRSARLSAR
jgi:type IV secretory pathway VirB10-like protein